MVYGYVRVSSRDQNETRQMIAMQEFKVDRIYCDKQSGKNFNRPQYQKMLRKIKKDDTLVVKSIDRLGRKYEDILEQWIILSQVLREILSCGKDSSFPFPQLHFLRIACEEFRAVAFYSQTLRRI